MEGWELDTEENPEDGIIVPVFSFEFTSAGKKLFREKSVDEIPSDEEAIQDITILHFPKIEIQKELLSTVSCSESLEIYSYTLHELVFQGDYKSIHHYRKHSYFEYKILINLIDLRGNTPLMLAAKLLNNGKNYEKIFKYLLNHEADASIKDACGWSLMDEIVIHKNKNACSALFDYLYKEKLNKWKANKHVAIEALQRLPDFYVEINWEFDSSVIPLVSRIAPHDVCKLWKIGNRFRIDTTLVGWKKLRSKRRPMSLFFCQNESGEIFDEILIANHQKKVLVRTFEPLDSDEKAAVVGDILLTEPMQGEANILSYKVKPCLNWRSRPVTQKISNWPSLKHKVSYKGQVVYKKKLKNFGPCLESTYFSTDSTNTSSPIFSYSSTKEPTRTLIKASKASVWLSKDFPFPLQNFLPILQIVSESNSTIKKLYNFLSDQNLLQQIGPDSFPVKIDIPLTLSVKAVVTFDKFQTLSDPKALDLPNYSFESRKKAQKILTCPKKRVILANLVI